MKNHTEFEKTRTIFTYKRKIFQINWVYVCENSMCSKKLCVRRYYEFFRMITFKKLRVLNTQYVSHHDS